MRTLWCRLPQGILKLNKINRKKERKKSLHIERTSIYEFMLILNANIMVQIGTVDLKNKQRERGGGGLYTYCYTRIDIVQIFSSNTDAYQHLRSDLGFDTNIFQKYVLNL